ncbi:MAG TPA: hypothetical protein ENF73_00315 [Proteobacteria bacterium]|nr:hypothetical protein [Pseudomonadota bacterium]
MQTAAKGKSAKEHSGGAAWAAIAGAVCALVFRYGFFGISSLSLIPSSSSFRAVLLALVCTLLIRALPMPFLRGRAKAYAWQVLTFVEWVCWTFLMTDPFLSVYIYLAISIDLPEQFSLYDASFIAISTSALATALFALWSARQRRGLPYLVSFYTSSFLVLLMIFYALIIPKHKSFGVDVGLLCSSDRVKNVEPILSYPCHRGDRWCKVLFESGNLYNAVYHRPTNRFIASGGNSRILLFVNADTKRTEDVMVFGGSVRYLTYDPFRDRLLVDVRSRRCLVEVDPYSASETNCYFRDIAFDSMFQLGCFDRSGDVLTFTVDTEYRLYRRVYGSGKEDIYDIFPLSCAYGLVCLDGNRVVVSSMCPSPLLRSGIWVMRMQPGFEVVRKKRLIFPALDMEYDPTHDLIYLARAILNRVDIYRASDMSKAGTLKVPSGTRELALDGTGRFLYAGSMTSGRIVKIDLETGRIVERYRIGPMLRQLSYEKDLDSVIATSACGVFRLK